MDKIILEHWMPVKDYATKHNITIDAVYKRIERGTVITKKLGSLILVYTP